MRRRHVPLCRRSRSPHPDSSYGLAHPSIHPSVYPRTHVSARPSTHLSGDPQTLLTARLPHRMDSLTDVVPCSQSASRSDLDFVGCRLRRLVSSPSLPCYLSPITTPRTLCARIPSWTLSLPLVVPLPTFFCVPTLHVTSLYPISTTTRTAAAMLMTPVT